MRISKKTPHGVDAHTLTQRLRVPQDVPGAVSVEEMTELLSLHKLCCGRSWHIQGCDARSGMGLHEGLDWLSRQLVAAGVLDVA